jgi:hypothetical protein
MIGSLVCTPSYCRRAWVRFLRRQGCSYPEIAEALRMPVMDVARLARLTR